MRKLSMYSYIVYLCYYLYRSWIVYSAVVYMITKQKVGTVFFIQGMHYEKG